MTASSKIATGDTIQLASGGAINGAGADVLTDARVDNTLSIGTGVLLKATGDISLGTYTDASTNVAAEVSTWGLAAVGVALAKVILRTDQTVTVGSGSTIDALGNVDVKAGVAEGGQWRTILAGTASAQAYIRGLIAIPIATADADMTSNATVTSAATIRSGLNTAVAADPGAVIPNADGTARGFQLGFIPVTVRKSNATPRTTSVVTLTGTVTAGAYSKIDLTITDCQNSGVFCSTITDNGSSAPWSAEFVPNFILSTWAQANLTGPARDTANDSDGISTTAVGATIIRPFFVSGGIVTLQADQLSGGALVTANGRPTFSLLNNSRNYVVLLGGTIPDLPGGQVLFTGAAKTGVTAVQNFKGEVGKITVENAYACGGVTECVGNSAYGPAIISVGRIENLGGSVTLKNTAGSVLELGEGIQAGQKSIFAPQGFVRIRKSDPSNPHLGGTPYTEWRDQMIWPGGNPASGEPNADRAIEWVASGRFPNSTNLNSDLYHFAGASTSDGSNRGYAYFGGCVPIANASALSNYCSYDAAVAWSVSKAAPYNITSSDTPLRWLPSITKQKLSQTLGASAGNYTGSAAARTDARQLAISGQTIDINTLLNVGGVTQWSVRLPTALGTSLQRIFTAYSSGSTSQRYWSIDVGSQAGVITTGDSFIKATYDAYLNQIALDNVIASSGGAQVRISGGLMSTNTLGRINVNAGVGRVEVDNQTGITVVVNNIYAGSASATAGVESTVELLDTYTNQHTLYTYSGNGITRYQGALAKTVAELKAGNVAYALMLVALAILLAATVATARAMAS